MTHTFGFWNLIDSFYILDSSSEMIQRFAAWPCYCSKLDEAVEIVCTICRYLIGQKLHKYSHVTLEFY